MGRAIDVHVHQPQVVSSVRIFTDRADDDGQLAQLDMARLMNIEECLIGDEGAPPSRHAPEPASRPHRHPEKDLEDEIIWQGHSGGGGAFGTIVQLPMAS
jgi:hypothetical protein